MKTALKQAETSAKIGEVPIGAMIVHKGEIIAMDHNRTILDNDPTSHAELNVIRQACIEIDNYRLVESTLVVTLEPCAMCYGAIIQSRISTLIFGAYDLKTGVCGSCLSLQDSDCFNHRPKIIGGILEDKCSLVLKNFFKEKRV